MDAAADRMWTAIYEKLSQEEKYKRNGNYLHDLQVEEEKRRIIDEEILNEIVYVK